MVKYLMAFAMYTLAMIGIFFVAFVVYKKATSQNINAKKAGLKVEDALRLSQRKTLYVLSYKSEKFLIAADVESTTFLSKLESNKQLQEYNADRVEKYLSESENADAEQGVASLQMETEKGNVMRNILSELAKKG